MNTCNLYDGVVTIKDFETYTGNYEESEEVVRMKIDILKSAQQIVESYLNYTLESKICVDEHIGCNNNKILLNCRPVALVHWVRVNGLYINDYNFDYQSVYRTDGKVFDYRDMVMIEYETNVTAVPSLVKQTILRIAALLLQESDGNIGITGKAANDGMSRTYISYNNYSKYLEPLHDYRVFRL